MPFSDKQSILDNSLSIQIKIDNSELVDILRRRKGKRCRA